MPYKTMSVIDFVERGYLQELNRRFLHPLGLSLQVENGQFKEIVDSRDSENGLNYKEGLLQEDKRDFVEFEYSKKNLNRLRTLGYIIQPITKE